MDEQRTIDTSSQWPVCIGAPFSKGDAPPFRGCQQNGPAVLCESAVGPVVPLGDSRDSAGDHERDHGPAGAVTQQTRLPYRTNAALEDALAYLARCDDTLDQGQTTLEEIQRVTLVDEE